MLTVTFVFSACSFDYGEGASKNDEQPNIIMTDVEYVRVRNGDPLVRFTAESAERYDKRQTMELRNFLFEQFEHHGDGINTTGRAGTASVKLDSGNICFRDGVQLQVESEDITIETAGLDWQDQEKRLSAGEHERVDMQRSDGTNFSGRGFSANIQDRTWGFSSGIQGTYIWEDNEKKEAGEDAEPSKK